MKYGELFLGGPSVSRLALGTWQTVGDELNVETSRGIIQKALELGINFFDTADIYANGDCERVLGSALSGIPRDSYLLATKCFFDRPDVESGRLSKKNIEACLERSLKKLNLECIDLLQCHRFDEETPIQETIYAMNGLINSGKIRHWGVSRWSPEQLKDVMEVSGHSSKEGPKTTQHFYNVFNREIEQGLADVCNNNGLGLITYSPLAQGVLSGKYNSIIAVPGTRSADSEKRKTMWEFNARRIRQVQSLRDISDEMGISLATLCLSWCLRNSNVNTVIFGASSIDQLEENAASAEVDLGVDDYIKINSIIEGENCEEY